MGTRSSSISSTCRKRSQAQSTLSVDVEGGESSWAHLLLCARNSPCGWLGRPRRDFANVIGYPTRGTLAPQGLSAKQWDTPCPCSRGTVFAHGITNPIHVHAHAHAHAQMPMPKCPCSNAHAQTLKSRSPTYADAFSNPRKQVQRKRQGSRQQMKQKGLTSKQAHAGAKVPSKNHRTSTSAMPQHGTRTRKGNHKRPHHRRYRDPTPSSTESICASTSLIFVSTSRRQSALRRR